MGIARPDLRKKKQRRNIIIVAATVLVAAVALLGASRLKPAAPLVDRGTVWTDTVKRGPMLRQVRGVGTLIPSPEDVRLIPAETEATVMRIRALPGIHVTANTVLLEMSNPQLQIG